MCIASRLVPQCHALPARVWYRTRAFGPSFASVATAGSTSLAVVLMVGTVLNLINQGDALLADRHVNLAKIVPTFVVLYCVATYGAVSYRLSATRQQEIRFGEFRAKLRHCLLPTSCDALRRGVFQT